MRLEHLLSGGFGDIVDIVIFSGDVFSRLSCAVSFGNWIYWI